MKAIFYRLVIVIAGLALLLDGLALVDFALHPLAGDHTFQSALYRALTVLVLMPFTVLVGFLIIRRVPGNVVGPLLIMWSGTIAYNAIRANLGPALFGLYYAYDLIFGWFALFLMFLHFPDGRIYPERAARLIYSVLGFNFLFGILIFFSTDPLQTPAPIPNLFLVPALLPYAQGILTIGLVLLFPILVLTPISFVLRYRKGSLLERQQLKWLALLGGYVVLYTFLIGIVFPITTGSPVMTPGLDASGMLFYVSTALLPPLAIGIAVLRYRLWDIDRLIRRTLVYSSLTVILALIYFGSVVSLQTIFGLLFPLGSNDFAIVLSTLAIAALFNPLRGRIQRGIDRRFFRQKYSTEQAIASFAAIARREVALEPLATALLDNVEETLHPEAMALWLAAKGDRD